MSMCKSQIGGIRRFQSRKTVDENDDEIVDDDEKSVKARALDDMAP